MFAVGTGFGPFKRRGTTCSHLTSTTVNFNCLPERTLTSAEKVLFVDCRVPYSLNVMGYDISVSVGSQSTVTVTYQLPHINDYST